MMPNLKHEVAATHSFPLTVILLRRELFERPSPRCPKGASENAERCPLVVPPRRIANIPLVVLHKGAPLAKGRLQESQTSHLDTRPPRHRLHNAPYGTPDGSV